MSESGKFDRSPAWEEKLFQVLYRLIQTVRIHRDNNELVKLCLSDFHDTVAKLDIEDELSIMISDGRFFVQGERLHYRRQIARLINTMLEFFNRRGLRGVIFHSGVKEAPHSDLLAFVRLLIQSGEKEDSAAWLTRNIEEAGFGWVTVLAGEELRHKQMDEDLRVRVRTAYSLALSAVKEVAQKISYQGYAGVRKARRMVQTMVDGLEEDSAILLALSAIKDYDDYTYTHSVNVAVLALSLGNRIGLSRSSLEHLGICALFHDLGKVEIPREIITKQGELTDDEREIVQMHPLGSVKQILKLNASHDLKSRILLGPFEHHVKYDLTGYPNVLFKKQVSLFGRILQIADFYDAITSPRAYRAFSLSPDQAIRTMLEGAGKDFDPILVKEFAIMLGRYPVGTLLELDTGEMGLVVGYGEKAGVSQPQVVLLQENEQGGFQRGEMVNLFEEQKEGGTSPRKVLRSFNPASLGIRTQDFVA
ncbi:MAG: HD domain-containing protein [Deltaproteobacteria bacterium]|nr:HD domain-containing protein [Deltaproteobacteria bacterium]